MAAKLRTVLIFVLRGGMIAVAVGVIIGLHLSVFTAAGPQAPNPVPTRTLLPRKFPTGAAHVTLGHFPVGPLLYGLLIVALLAAVWLSVWWSRRFRRPALAAGTALSPRIPRTCGRRWSRAGRRCAPWTTRGPPSSRATWRWRTSLAERGAARAVADTPDELLARAIQDGIVRGTAAARLTALFYEARFSSHPLDRGQRDAAEQALDELAAALTRCRSPGEAEAAP